MIWRQIMYRLFKYNLIIITLIWVMPASAGLVWAPIDNEFSLGIGQSASFDSEKLVIKFKAVLEDSRCPINAVCAWAGNGKVELEVLDSDGKNKTIILNTEDEPKATALKGHKLKLVSLNPPRIDGVSISRGDYSVILLFERMASTS
jgi:hypothetical protein